MTLEQKRAAHALECVGKVKAKGEAFAARYRSYAESLPAHIVMGGLGQALATELAAARGGEKQRNDGQEAHGQLATDLASWLGETTYSKVKDQKKAGWLLQAIVENDQKLYLHAQAEALAWLVWLKKLCQATLPKGPEAED